MPAAIRAGGAIDVALYFTGKDLKGLVVAVVGRKMAPKRDVLVRLRGSEPKYFSQVGNHALRVSPQNREKQGASAGESTR
jgi:hypothetical protein